MQQLPLETFHTPPLSQTNTTTPVPPELTGIPSTYDMLSLPKVDGTATTSKWTTSTNSTTQTKPS